MPTLATDRGSIRPKSRKVAPILSVGGAEKMKELDRRLNRGYVSQSVARLGLLLVLPRQVDTTWVWQLQE
jgi:hypothetical protein